MDIEKLSLDESLDMLEKISNEMDNDDFSLEKSIELYENGVKLAAHAKKLLDGYSKRITVLKKENNSLTEVLMEDKSDD